jgi:hypothetical protein
MTINGLKNLRHVLHEHRLCRKKEVATFSCTLMISQSKVASAVSYMSQKRIPSLTTVSSKHVMMAKNSKNTYQKCFNQVNLYQHNAKRTIHGANALEIDTGLA